MIISHKSAWAPVLINEDRDRTLAAGFYWSPKQARFDTDPRSIALITGRVAKIHAMQALGQEPAPFLWRDQDNQDHTFTASEFLQLAIDLDEWVEQLYLDSWAQKAAL